MLIAIKKKFFLLLNYLYNFYGGKMTYNQAYQILEINEQASNDEIKKAYKAKAKKYHPDIYKGDKKIAEEKMKQINEAYDLLCKPKTSTSSTYSSNYDTEYYARAQKAREEFEKAQREFEEEMRKIHEEFEKIIKEREEFNKKFLKMSKIILSLLEFMLEFYLFKLLFTAIESIIITFNDKAWFFFGLWIVWGLMALAGVILAPIGFIWLMKKAKIFK